MKKRPNIIFLLSDDQGEWAMGCSGNKEIITPNLDRLAAEGMRFDSFFCASPVCSPARASLLTGRIPSQHGVHDWLRDDNKKQEDIEYLKGQTAYTDILQEEGYSEDNMKVVCFGMSQQIYERVQNPRKALTTGLPISLVVALIIMLRFTEMEDWRGNQTM